jgi:sialic acid synthase SpsE/protoporphyrinogen oxidase
MEDLVSGNGNYMKIWIIGGGITGLNTAREMSKKGIDVELFESSERLGGLAGSIKGFGRNLDLGPHIYHTPDNDIRDYLVQSLPDVFFERKHYGKNYLNGKYYDYPISQEFIESLPIDVREQIKKELKNSNPEKAKNAITYYDYIDAIAGKTLREMFFTKYPKKLWGKDTKELDANWAPKRVQIRDIKSPFFGNQWSAVGINGTQSIIDEMLKQCNTQNVVININTKVISIEYKKNIITKLLLNDNTYREINENDIILNTASLSKASEIFGFKHSVTYRGVCLVYVKINRPKANFENICDFVYIDNPDIIFNRVSSQNKSVKYESTIDNVLCCEIAYSKNDRTDQALDETIIRKVKDDLIKSDFIDKDMFEDSIVLRIPEVYPMFSVGYREKMNDDFAELGKFSNLVNIGSLAEFAYSDLQILFAKSRDFSELVSSKTQRINQLGYSRIRLKKINKFKIFDSEIRRKNKRAFLIAEIGLNHNGSIELGKKLIDSAKNAGFDAVKFQTYKSEGRSASKGKTSKYVEKVLNIEETDNTMFKKYELNYKQHKILFEYAKDNNIPFFSAPFDLESVAELNELGVEAFKIASMEVTNVELIDHVARTKKPIIISSGMAEISDLEKALKVCFNRGNYKVAILHCTSIYPAPPSAMNLKAIKTMKSTFKVPVGLSDHYPGNALGFAAIGLGASIIEKHVTLDRRLEGPDHVLSLDPKEQKEFVKGIRDIEKSLLSSGIKQPHEDEIKSEIRFKKTLYIKSDIKKGEILTKEYIELKAPAYGLKPEFMPLVVGRVIKRDLSANSPLRIEDLDS